MMNPKEWNQVESAFAEGMKLPAPERTAFWQQQFRHDPRLKAELELLIRGEQQAAVKGFLDKAAWSLVARSEASKKGIHSSMIGKLIENYEILRSIGSGGMGDVYLAKDRKLGRDVALKIVRDPSNQHALIRFLDEMRILSKIEHDNVARLYDSGMYEENHPFIVMEYLRGFLSLRDYLASVAWRGLPLGEVKTITRQFCTGLAQAHDQNIIHRDIKPENIMLINDRDGLRVKVIDFGVAIGPAFTPEELAQGVMTHQASTFSPGTAVYKSPEQLENQPREHIKTTSDVYSAALVIYEMLSGRRAYPSSEHRIHEKEFPAASALRPELGAKIDSVLQRALSHQPQDRQPDIRTLADEVIAALPDAAELADRSTVSLDRMLLGTTEQETRLRKATEDMETIAASPKLNEPENIFFAPSTKNLLPFVESTQPLTRRNRLWLVGGIGLATLLLAALGWYVWQSQPQAASSLANQELATAGSPMPNRSIEPGVPERSASVTANEQNKPVQKINLMLYRNNETSPATPDTIWRSGNSVKFKLNFNQDGYLYVLNRGSNGELQVLFPHHAVNQGTNRVASNQSITMPPASSTKTGGFRLDEQPGEETFFFVFASNDANQDALLSPIKTAIGLLGNKQGFATLALPKHLDWLNQLRAKSATFDQSNLNFNGSGVLVKAVSLRHVR